MEFTTTPRKRPSKCLAKYLASTGPTLSPPDWHKQDDTGRTPVRRHFSYLASVTSVYENFALRTRICDEEKQRHSPVLSTNFWRCRDQEDRNVDDLYLTAIRQQVPDLYAVITIHRVNSCGLHAPTVISHHRPITSMVCLIFSEHSSSTQSFSLIAHAL